MNFDDALNEVDTVTIDKELRTNDFAVPELELPDKEKNSGGSGGGDTSGGGISADFSGYVPRTAY